MALPEWEIISTYAPEVIAHRREQVEMPNDLSSYLAQFSGTEFYHVDAGLLLTDGVSYLLNITQAYDLLDLIKAHLSAIAAEEDAFCVIDIATDGHVDIHDGRSPRQHLVLGKLSAGIPCSVRLFTGIFSRYLVLMLASEY